MQDKKDGLVRESFANVRKTTDDKIEMEDSFMRNKWRLFKFNFQKYFRENCRYRESDSKKFRKNQFTLEDFLEQFGQIRKMGGIAKMLDMPQPQYYRYEQGFRDIPTDILIKLAEIYNTSTDYILERTDNIKPI